MELEQEQIVPVIQSVILVTKQDYLKAKPEQQNIIVGNDFVQKEKSELIVQFPKGTLLNSKDLSTYEILNPQIKNIENYFIEINPIEDESLDIFAKNLLYRKRYNGIIDYYPKLIPFFLLDSQQLMKLDKKESAVPKTYYFCFYEHDSIDQFRKEIAVVLNKLKIELVGEDNQIQFVKNDIFSEYIQEDQIRLWQKPENSTLLEVFSFLHKETSASKTYDYRIEVNNWKIVDSRKQIKNLDFSLENPIILEIRNSNRGFYFLHPGIQKEDVCESCKRYKVLMVACSCKKAEYCSKECQNKDLEYHQQKCMVVLNDLDEKAEEMKENEFSKYGLVGLANLGNTCFMNSGIQCLVNLDTLREYFLNDHYKNEINLDNPLGSKGALVKFSIQKENSLL